MDPKSMIEKAMQARSQAYAPYSQFMVGACLETKSGKQYFGCNIENSSFGATNCAERTAFYKAVSEGEREFTKIAIIGGKKDGEIEICPPCGICLQVMSEFCDPETFQVILGDTTTYKVLLLKELLPMSFALEL